MASLPNLPNEILIAILERLANTDLQSLISSQRTSSRFHALARDILFNTQGHHLNAPAPSSFPGFLKARFGYILNTAACFTEAEKKTRIFYLSLNGDSTRPFRRFPWARDRDTRAAYLRPDASWRALSPTFGTAPITHLDVVRSYACDFEGADVVSYAQADLPPSGLTLGMLWDMLLSDGGTFGSDTGSWEVQLGRRLRSFDTLWEFQCFITDNEALVVRGDEAAEAAILYVRGSQDSVTPPLRCDEDGWIPGRIGECPPRLLPWQGPLQNPETLESLS
ncbi:Uu.00g012910.m01.CDS01 [Anthostomella pinea]|uniref:Uu.00g012910.m01.CDS01 n=1 Tax=Anthostomella pinea TaxID=933095 RepID=A0AAI8YMY2_9PEZI|nr:Uu.00g012910.m01.CDS01 [Anthostomella pinea]